MSLFDPEPWLGKVDDGTGIHIAGKAWYRDSQKAAYHCTTALHGQPFLLTGVDLKGDRFTIFEARKSTDNGSTVLTATPSTTMIHSLIDRDGATEVIDICSGYGIMTAGYHLIMLKSMTSMAIANGPPCMGIPTPRLCLRLQGRRFLRPAH